MPLQIRRGTNAERQAMSIPLAPGELLYVTDDQRLYVGNGSTLGGLQITGYTDQDAKDAAAVLFTTGTHSNISFVYDNGAGKVNATIDLTNYAGNITAAAFKGSLFADDGSTISGKILVDAIAGTINLDSTIAGNVIPTVNNLYDLGSTSYRFKKLFVGSSGIEVGSAAITNPSGSIVNLPVGSTVGGIPISTLDTAIGGHISASIIGADSTVIVDSELNKFTGTFEGDITGSLFSDSSVLLVSGIDAYISNGVVSIADNIISSSVSLGEIEIANSLVVDNEGVQINSDATTPWFEAYLKNTAGAITPYFSYAHRGTKASPTVLSNGDSIWSQSWLAYDGSTYVGSAALEIQVDTVASGDAPAKIFLVTIPNNNSAQAKGIQITEDGVSINTGTTAPAATLDINGFAKLAVLTSAPASPADGMVAIADGTSWDPAGTGKSVMVVHLAGGWRVAATAP